MHSTLCVPICTYTIPYHTIPYRTIPAWLSDTDGGEKRGSGWGPKPADHVTGPTAINWALTDSPAACPIAPVIGPKYSISECLAN